MVASNGKNQYLAMAEAIADALKPHFHNLSDTLGKKIDMIGDKLDRHLEGAASISVRVARLERDVDTLKRRK